MSGLVRVSVIAGARRVDLVLPGSVPVAELVPELARSVGLLDAATVHGGYRVVTASGRELSGEAGLVLQGVEDGGLLTVTAGVDQPPPRIYDDLAEAMTDVVERDLERWSPASGRRTALCAAVMLTALGGGALLLQRDSLLAGAAACVVAVVLLASAIVLSRVLREPETAVAVAWLGTGYAALGPLMLSLREGQPFLGLALAGGGAGALLAGLVGVVGLGDGRVLTIPPLVVGAIALVTGLVLRILDVDAAALLTTTLALVVLAGSVLPRLALGVTGASADRDEIDLDRVRADARIAHQILVALSVSVGVLLVLVAPLAVSIGLSGTFLAVDASLVVMLRTRQHSTGAEVLVGLSSGILGLASAAASLLWMHPEWRPTAAVVLATTGALVLACTLLFDAPSLRRGRLADIAETACLLAILPLLVLATGVFASIRS